MKTGTVTVVNRLGMHARPSALLVTTATKYESEIFLTRDGTRVNGKSIMGVMMLAAEKGSEILVEADGPDEETAFKAVVGIIKSGFGEDE
ncbi:MAG: HPr family phosphocarrier protein [candidate division Zixibacteria bacterium]|nr:HPr family phosphocarrier protein [candidate division Zixibacteria bacterium]